MGWWMVAEYTVFAVHTVILAFILGGFHRWKDKSQRMFYVHRGLVGTVFMIQAIYGQCPITALEKYCRTQYDTSYKWEGVGCIEEATTKLGVPVPNWCVRVGIFGVGVKGLVQVYLAYRVAQKKKDEELWAA